MKTEDELDAEIAKLFDEVTITKVEMVNGKPQVDRRAHYRADGTGRGRTPDGRGVRHVLDRRTSVPEA